MGIKNVYKWRIATNKYLYLTNEDDTNPFILDKETGTRFYPSPATGIMTGMTGVTGVVLDEGLITEHVSSIMRSSVYESKFNRMVELASFDDDAKKLTFLSYDNYFNIDGSECAEQEDTTCDCYEPVFNVSAYTLQDETQTAVTYTFIGEKNESDKTLRYDLNIGIPRGLPGEPGEPGIGVKGDKGDDGEPAKFSSIQATAVSGETTSVAIATAVTGINDYQLRFDFTLQKGDPGEPGVGIPGSDGHDCVITGITATATSVAYDQNPEVTIGEITTQFVEINDRWETSFPMNFKIPVGEQGEPGNPGLPAKIIEAQVTSVTTVDSDDPNGSWANVELIDTHINNEYKLEFSFGLQKGKDGLDNTYSGDTGAIYYTFTSETISSPDFLTPFLDWDLIEDGPTAKTYNLTLYYPSSWDSEPDIKHRYDYYENDSDSLSEGVVEYVNDTKIPFAGAYGFRSHAEGIGFNDDIEVKPNAYGIASHSEGKETYAEGDYSHAEGSGTTASGNTSHAEGSGTTAGGTASHAEGQSTTASGFVSHAEGSGTTASGDFSHAEGSATTASGIFSHAEGWGTKASGETSHAEGISTQANGSASHAEGYQTSALTQYAHAEGYRTIANANYSHAEGSGTTAGGTASHAEGQSTQATGQASHTEGYNTTANTIYAHAEGSGTKASGSTAHAEGSGTTAGGQASHAEGISTQATGSTAHAEGNNTRANGIASHAEGSGTTANTTYAHAEGLYTQANGSASHAEGNTTSATTQYAHAEGSGTTASNEEAHAEGKGTTASGKYSHAEGSGTTASLDGAHAEGLSTSASGKASHAEGYQTSATTSYAHAEGNGCLASGETSHAEGISTQATGKGSHAEGYQTSALTQYAHAEGSGTTASGKTSHAEGTATQAIGDYSHAEGSSGTTASGKTSHAEGQNTHANGTASHSEGNGTTASGKYSHAEGQDTKAGNEASHAEGYRTIANANYSHAEGVNGYTKGEASHAEGKYTTAWGKYSHAEGYGKASEITGGTFSWDTNSTQITWTPESGTSNEHHIIVGDILRYGDYPSEKYTKVTDVTGNTIVISDSFVEAQSGVKLDRMMGISSGDYSHTEGQSSRAIGESSHAEGVSSKAIGQYSHAEGYNSTANGQGSHAEGGGHYNKWGVEMTFDGGIAIGNASHAEGVSFKYPIELTYSTGDTSYVAYIDDSLVDNLDFIETLFRKNSLIYNEGQTEQYLITNFEVYHDTGETVYVIRIHLDDSVGEISDSSLSWNAAPEETFTGIIVTGIAYAPGSHIEGGMNRAYGDGSHAEGACNIAIRDFSHAEGEYNVAEGWCSHAEGEYNVASGELSHAEGAYTTASGGVSHTEGYETTATDLTAHAEGYFSTASGNASHAEGEHTTASGGVSHAEGGYTSALDDCSHAEGRRTTAMGRCSHAEGSETTALKTASHAEGIGSFFTDDIGNGVFTWQNTSNTLTWTPLNSGETLQLYEGDALINNLNQEDRDIIEIRFVKNITVDEHGIATVVINSPFANEPNGVGRVINASIAGGQYSHTEGNNTVTLNKGEHAEGNYNVSNRVSIDYGYSGNTTHSIGIGTSSLNRKNAFEVMENGDIYITSGHTSGLDTLYNGTNAGVSGVNTLQDMIKNAASGGGGTDTWRAIQVDNNEILGTGTTTNALNLSSGTNITLSATTGGTVTISAPSAVTSNSTLGTSDGAVVIKNGNNNNREVTVLSNGTTGQVLKMGTSGKPEWGTDYTAVPILAATSGATTNATSDTQNDATFLNIIENNTVSGSIQIEGSGDTSVKAKNGKLTISSSGGGGGTDTWRAIQVDNSEILGTGTTTNKLNLKSGNGVTLSTGITTSGITDIVINTRFLPVDPFWFALNSDGCGIYLNTKPNKQSLEYSLDEGITWTVWNTGTTNMVTGNTGTVIHVRGTLSGATSASDYTNFRTSGGTISVFGNINTLWDYKNPKRELYDYCGYALFEGCSIIQANNLIIPDANAAYCYYGMFRNVTTLQTAPQLLGNQLGRYCYNEMFKGCSSLTTAPELSAEILTERCYSNMFSGCTSLNVVKCLATSLQSSYCTGGWLTSVPTGGTFIKSVNTEALTGQTTADQAAYQTGKENKWYDVSVNSIPSGWTIRNDSVIEDTKVRQSSSITNDVFPILASNQTSSLIENGATNEAIYVSSIAINPNRRSVVEGSGTTASGLYSHAEGIGSKALGEASHAEGSGTTVTATAYDAHAEGNGTTASGAVSHAEGRDTTASGNYSHAEGRSTQAIGARSHAEGNTTVSYCSYSHAEGQFTATRSVLTEDEFASHSEGKFNIADGISSHVEGCQNLATNDYSHTEGGLSTTVYVTNFRSLSITSDSIEFVLDDYRIESGLDTGITEDYISNNTVKPIVVDIKVNNIHYTYFIDEQDTGTTQMFLDTGNTNVLYIDKTLHPDGIPSAVQNVSPSTPGIEISVHPHINIASGICSHAEGCFTRALGNVSHAGGLGTIAYAHNMTAIGRYNATGETTSNTLFVIGNGESHSSRTDAFYVTNEGKCYASNAFFAASDERKKNIVDNIPLEKAYELLHKCQTVLYIWKNDDSKERQIGLLAQEVQNYFPELVLTDAEGYLSLDYSKITVVLMRVIKDMEERLTKLETLEKRIKLLEEKLK